MFSREIELKYLDRSVPTLCKGHRRREAAMERTRVSCTTANAQPGMVGLDVHVKQEAKHERIHSVLGIRSEYLGLPT